MTSETLNSITLAVVTLYLESVDGVNFCDDDTATETTKGLSTALANVTVT